MTMKNNPKTDEAKDMIEFARFVRAAGSEPLLSKADKKQVLDGILPRRSYFVVWAPAFAMCAVAVVVLSGYGFVRGSKPGDSLYKVLRTTEDIRSKVQPSFDNKLVERRDAEISNLLQSGAPEAKVQIAETEKKVIEERIQTRASEAPIVAPKETPTKPDTKLPTVAAPVTTQKSEQKDTDKKKAKSSSDKQKDAIEKQIEACKESLDKRREKGEKISSDQYKQCETVLPKY
jgi:hypothetical protein